MRLLIVTAISTLLLISGAFAQSNSPSDTPNERAKTKTQELEKARSEAQRGNSDTKGDKQNAAQTEAVQAEHPGWYSENKPYRPCPDRSRNQWTQHLSGVPRTMSISSIVSAGEQVVRFDILPHRLRQKRCRRSGAVSVASGGASVLLVGWHGTWCSERSVPK